VSARLALVATVFLVAGCAVLDRLLPPSSAPAAPVAMEPAPAAVRAERSAGQELVTYLARLRTLSEAALATETSRQRQAAARSPSDLARVKLALALTMGPQAEDSEIVAVVEPLSRREGTDPEVRAMASFLLGIALERRRLKESAAAAGAKLRDERRAREVEKQRAEALQERAAQLQQKLDALTDLEKSLSDRPTSRQ
jgi:hypothetical protein